MASDPPRLRLTLLAPIVSVARLAPETEVPAWALSAGAALRSVTWTGQELSIVCEREAIPPDVTSGPPQRALEVAGPLAFELTGVLAALAAPLAEAAIPIFALSTHDTDYVLVPEDRCGEAVEVLRAAGHEVLKPRS